MPKVQYLDLSNKNRGNFLLLNVKCWRRTWLKTKHQTDLRLNSRLHLKHVHLSRKITCNLYESDIVDSSCGFSCYTDLWETGRVAFQACLPFVLCCVPPYNKHYTTTCWHPCPSVPERVKLQKNYWHRAAQLRVSSSRRVLQWDGPPIVVLILSLHRSRSLLPNNDCRWKWFGRQQKCWLMWIIVHKEKEKDAPSSGGEGRDWRGPRYHNHTAATDSSYNYD